jgi:hypothetical protein
LFTAAQNHEEAGIIQKELPPKMRNHFHRKSPKLQQGHYPPKISNTQQKFYRNFKHPSSPPFRHSQENTKPEHFSKRLQVSKEKNIHLGEGFSPNW